MFICKATSGGRFFEDFYIVHFLYEYRLTYQIYLQLGDVAVELIVTNRQDTILWLLAAKSEDGYKY